MQIKVFKASSMKEAVAKMKAELGDDAVILHTKKYKEGGLLGLGSKEMVEITAAIEDEPAPKKEPEIEEIPQRSSPLMPQSVLSQYKTNGTAEGVAIAEREISSISRSTTQPSATSEHVEENVGSPTDSMMGPTVNQASSLEAAMKPNQKTAKPDLPMSYNTVEDSPTPYEVDISSRSDLNTPKSESSTETSNSVNNFVQARSGELTESDIENEPDENVYTAEPVNQDNTNSQSITNEDIQNVNTSSETGQVRAEQVEPTPVVSQTKAAEEISPQSTQQFSQIQQQSSQNTIPTNQLPSQNSVEGNMVSAPPVQQIQTNQQQNNQTTQQNQYNNSEAASQPNLQNQQTPFSDNTPPTQMTQPNQPAQNINQQSNNVPQQSSEQLQSAANSNQQQAQQADMNQPLTPSQLAQAQAMMMAQFNQMQMAQAMQQAMAQVQAQAQEQVRQAYLQAQQSVEQIKAQDKKPPQSNNPEPQNKEKDKDSQDKIKQLENEIAQMKALLAQVMGKDGKQGSVSLHEALKKQEVNENILNDMAAHSEAGETLADSQSREAKTTLVKFLNENINFSDGIKLNRHGVRIAALLGTTGVGKTTTLAKIAAKFVLEQGITAALITADTYRISAVEQLRTYSDILGLPLEIVYSPAELSKAINKFRNRDLILIDTAGRSQHNEYQMKELQEFLRANQRIEKHIVLSSTTKASDAIDILDKFSVCEPDKIIFTKTDETASVGLIVNLLYKQKLSLSYVTNGQSVPDDITPASAEVLADLLLRKNV